MKKILLIICVLLAQSAFAQRYWTVETVPNTRLQGDDIHVSDPDGYLSDSTEAFINDALSAIRDTADVFVVTLYSIGDKESKDFATTLFNYWGIGDAETNNGVLLLFVEDQRVLEFETGYGAEEALTDAACAHIFNQTILPFFKAGDYETGLCAGVSDIVMVFGGEVPEALTNRLDGRVGVYEYYPEVPYEDSMSAFGALFILFFLLPIPVISFFRWLLSLLAKKNEEIKLEGYEVKQKAGISYFDSPSLSMVSSVWNKKGFKRFLLYGVSLVAIYIIALYFVPDLFPDASSVAQNDWASGITLFTYLSLVCVVQNRMELKKADALAEGSKVSKAIYKRAKGDAHSVLARVMAPWLGVFYARAFKKRINESSYDCPICGQPMESADPIELPKVWSVEQEIGAYSLSYCRCASGHLLVERAKGPKYSKYAACDKCGAYAVEQTFVKLISAATYTESGSKEVTYSCKCCDNTYTVTQTIPKLVHTSSSSSGYHSHHSSSSHGSFGGGRSGGGGYSGRW